MGIVTNILKHTAAGTFSMMTSKADLNGMLSKVNDIKSNFDIPELEVPDKLKNLKSQIKVDNLKVPNADDYIQPIRSKMDGFMSGTSLPSEIGSFKLPTLPDLNTVTDKANSYIADTGFSLKQGLTFNDIKYAVTKQDISSILDFKIDMPIDMGSINHVADGTITSLDSFDMSETQREIDAITNQMNMESIDISQYF